MGSVPYGDPFPFAGRVRNTALRKMYSHKVIRHGEYTSEIPGLMIGNISKVCAGFLEERDFKYFLFFSNHIIDYYGFR